MQDVMSFGFDYDNMLDRLKHLPVVTSVIKRTPALAAGAKKITIGDFVVIIGKKMGLQGDTAIQLFTKMFHTVKAYLTSGGMMINYGKIALQLMGYNMC